MGWALYKGFILKIGLLFLLSFFGFFGEAKPSIEKKTITAQSQTKSPKMILEKAEIKMSEELVLEALGAGRFEQLKDKIEKNIFPKRRKFLLLTQLLDTKEMDSKGDKGEAFSSEVLVHFSRENLRKILIQENLFYSSKGARRAAVFIERLSPEDKIKDRWWASKILNSDDSKKGGAVFSSYLSRLQEVFLKKGFFLLHPDFARFRIMDEGSSGRLNPKSASRLAEALRAQIMILGTIKMEPLGGGMHQAIWDVALYDRAHLRKIAQDKARVKWPRNSWDFLDKKAQRWFETFASRLSSFYDEGSLSTRLFQIELLGRLSFLERKALKQALISKTNSIKGLTESLVSSKRILYTADIHQDEKTLLKEIQTLKLMDFKLSPQVRSKNHIVIQVQK